MKYAKLKRDFENGALIEYYSEVLQKWVQTDHPTWENNLKYRKVKK